MKILFLVSLLLSFQIQSTLSVLLDLSNHGEGKDIAQPSSALRKVVNPMSEGLLLDANSDKDGDTAATSTSSTVKYTPPTLNYGTSEDRLAAKNTRSYDDNDTNSKAMHDELNALRKLPQLNLIKHLTEALDWYRRRETVRVYEVSKKLIVPIAFQIEMKNSPNSMELTVYAKDSDFMLVLFDNTNRPMDAKKFDYRERPMDATNIGLYSTAYLAYTENLSTKHNAHDLNIDVVSSVGGNKGSRVLILQFIRNKYAEALVNHQNPNKIMVTVGSHANSSVKWSEFGFSEDYSGSTIEATSLAYLQAHCSMNVKNLLKQNE